MIWVQFETPESRLYRKDLIINQKEELTSQPDDALRKSFRQQLEEFLEINEGKDILRNIVEWILQELRKLEFSQQFLTQLVMLKL